jgi:hypothetical protein
MSYASVSHALRARESLNCIRAYCWAFVQWRNANHTCLSDKLKLTVIISWGSTAILFFASLWQGSTPFSVNHASYPAGVPYKIDICNRECNYRRSSWARRVDPCLLGRSQKSSWARAAPMDIRRLIFTIYHMEEVNGVLWAAPRLQHPQPGSWIRPCCLWAQMYGSSHQNVQYTLEEEYLSCSISNQTSQITAT